MDRYEVTVTTVMTHKLTLGAESHDDALSEMCKRVRSGMLDGMETDGPAIVETHTHRVGVPDLTALP